MAPFRYRDDDDASGTWLFIAAGAAVGLAAGLIVAQRFGGLSGVTSRLRERMDDRARGRRAQGAEPTDRDEADADERRRASAEAYGGDDIDGAADEELEERVLEAFSNDPILGERPIDIGAVGAGTIELTGSVYTADESRHAMTVAGGVPGVESVLNRLEVRAESEVLEDNRRRFDEGEDSLREAQWEGQGVGTGRRRQGNSSEFDRHSDPKVDLTNRSLSKDQALRTAADDVEPPKDAAVRNPPPRGHRAGGGSVPKADHGTDPKATPPDAYRAD